MDALENLTQKLQKGILEIYPSTLSTDGNITRIVSSLSGFNVRTDILRYQAELLHDSYHDAGLLGTISFTSQIDGFFKENLEFYKKSIGEFTMSTDYQVWVSGVNAPKNTVGTGLCSTMPVFQTSAELSQDAIMSALFIFLSVCEDYREFVNDKFKSVA